MSMNKNWDIFDAIKPDTATKQKILSNILDQLETTEKKEKAYTMKKLTLKNGITIAASAAAVVICVFAAMPLLKNEDLSPEISTSESSVIQNPSISQPKPSGDAPMGPRKFFNYNGHRYTFLSDTVTYTVSEADISTKLGTLEYDILANPDDNASKDFASTFAITGTVYQLKNYNPNFRIAVQHENTYYVCENVDTLNGEDVSVKTYFDDAEFLTKVNKIYIKDHFGRDTFKTLTDTDATKMIEHLSTVTPAELTSDEYPKIGRAQSDGKSFLIVFELNDGTSYKLYVIPTLSIAMIGDNKYTLTQDFLNEYSELFDTFKQQPLPVS